MLLTPSSLVEQSRSGPARHYTAVSTLILGEIVLTCSNLLHILFTSSYTYLTLTGTDPTTPNATQVQQILTHLEDSILAPHALPGIHLSRTLYASLPLPWTLPTPISAFPQSHFLRQEWDRDGVLSNGDGFFGGVEEQTLAQLAKGLDTASMVTRWRGANPGLAGTEADCVRESIRGIAETMGKRGVPLEEVRIRTGGAVVLLLFKRN